MALMFVNGNDSLTAPSGVLADGSTPGVVAINLDGYQEKAWGQFTQEINELLADLSATFPQKIRTQPGKFNPPLSPDPETQAVKDMISVFDPEGFFARDAYDPRFLVRPPQSNPSWWPF